MLYEVITLQFLIEYSPFLNAEKNRWMLMVLEVIRSTSLYFQPQIRTKILNEGWASYWHDTLFLQDDRIKGHEVDYAIVNAKVTSMPRVGLNPVITSYSIHYTKLYDVDQENNRGNGVELFGDQTDLNIDVFDIESGTDHPAPGFEAFHIGNLGYNLLRIVLPLEEILHIARALP